MAASTGNIPFVDALLEVINILLSDIENPDHLKEFINRFGWKFDVDNDPATLTAIEAAFNFGNVIYTIHDIAETLEDDDADTLAIIEQLIPVLETVYTTIKGLSSAPSATLLAPLNKDTFWTQLATELPDYLIISYLEKRLEKLHAFLFFLGIIDTKRITFPPDQLDRIAYNQKKIYWDRLFQILTDPGQLFKDVYHWDHGSHMFNHKRFITALEDLFDKIGLISELTRPSTALIDLYYHNLNHHKHKLQKLEIPFYFDASSDGEDIIEMGIFLFPIPKASNNKSHPAGFTIGTFVQGVMEAGTSEEELQLYFKGGFENDGFFRADIRPSGTDVILDGGATQVEAEGGFLFRPEDPKILLGSEGSHRIEIEGFAAALGIQGNLNDPEVYIKIGTDLDGEVRRLRFILQSSDGDGFIQKLIGEEPVSLDINGYMSWSSKHGFALNGNIGFEITIPIHQDFGPIGFRTFKIGASAGSGNEAKLSATIGINGNLGPVKLTIEDIGASLKIKKTTGNTSGTFGDLDLDWGFEPPKGVGLVVDAGMVKGGGYLYLDYEKGEYAGAAELTIQEIVSLKAIGIINTKMPDGSKGFALLLIITAEFQPIQLGFGFTLNGVGGLFAVNRAMNLDALRQGVRDGSINNILFPENPVEDAPQIIASLNNIFPIEEGQYSFGFMGKIGWGTPTLIEIELGLMIQVPDPIRIAILGVITAALPDKDHALLKIQVNFLGTVDFEKKLITFDASLYDSFILTFTLSGDMAFRLKWGDEPTFLLSVGGFHPDFTPPPLDLPDLRRLSITLLAGNPRLILSCYFAVTSNTVQFGASIDFLFKISGFKVIGFLYFHALFQFDPFYFIISIGAGLDVKLGSASILTVSVKGTLEGPTPWRIKGTGKFKILFVSVKIRIDKTFGDRQDTSLPGTTVLPKLEAALVDSRNWQATLASNVNLLVTMNEISSEEDTSTVVVHPSGTLSVNQNVVPLDLTIDKLGNQQPTDHNKFSLSATDDEDVVLDKTDIKDYFAPAEYLNLSETEKLSKASFVKYNSGIQIKGTEGIETAYFREKTVEYELKVLDSRFDPSKFVRVAESLSMFNHWAANNAVYKSKLGITARLKSEIADTKVAVLDEHFVLAKTDDLSLYGNGFTASNAYEAEQMLNSLIAENPALENTIQVIPSYELM